MSMGLGEKAELTIAGEHAYGARGSPPTIPANDTLIFTVELLKIDDREASKFKMDDGELIATAKKLKDDGNASFKQNECKDAEAHYKDALRHAEAVKIVNAELQELKKVILQNMSVMMNKNENYKETIKHCTKALEIDSKAVKALYLRSIAYDKVTNFDEAIEDAKNAIRIMPNEKCYRDHFEAVKKNKVERSKSQQAAMQKFFQSGVYNEKESVKQNHSKLPSFNPKNPQVFFDM